MVELFKQEVKLFNKHFDAFLDSFIVRVMLFILIIGDHDKGDPLDDLQELIEEHSLVALEVV